MDERRLEDDLAALARTEAAVPPDLRARLVADARAARPRLGARAWGGVAGAALAGLAVGLLAPAVVLDLTPLAPGAEAAAFAGWLETAALEEVE